MVTWRYREPHCFCCGSNLPFSDPDHVPSTSSSTDRVLIQEAVPPLEYEECLHKEGMSSIISFDPILDLAHKIFKKRRKRKVK